jgi:hypothetical protein
MVMGHRTVVAITTDASRENSIVNVDVSKRSASGLNVSASDSRNLLPICLLRLANQSKIGVLQGSLRVSKSARQRSVGGDVVISA